MTQEEIKNDPRFAEAKSISFPDNCGAPKPTPENYYPFDSSSAHNQ